jgi:CheY-like chemotaxis protein
LILEDHRILVADDDPANLDLVTSFLEANGFHVAAVQDGNRAVELGRSGDFELVILDVHMPLYTGVEVLRLLRKRYVLYPIKIIALTGDVTPEVRSALIGSGVDVVLTKPVDLHRLLWQVRELIGERAGTEQALP